MWHEEKAIQHIDELFAFEGRHFVEVAYQEILKRSADPHGMQLYLGRLARGYDKAEIIVDLVCSKEAGTIPNIPGLKRLIREVRWSRSPVLRWLDRKTRFERALRRLAFTTAEIQGELDENIEVHQANLQAFCALNETISTIAQQIKDVGSALEPRVEQAAQRLTPEEVREAFLDVLGRQPENDDVIAHHANFPGLQHLRITLMQSEEYRNKVQGEHAKFLFGRLTRVFQGHSAPMGI